MKNCIFCKIINKEIESKILYENDTLIVILDVFPSDIGHCLIITKKHKENILKLSKNELKEIALVQQKITNLLNYKLKPKGFNFLNNFNPIAGQIIDHYHLHIIPKYKKNIGFSTLTEKPDKKINIEEVWKTIKN